MSSTNRNTFLGLTTLGIAVVGFFVPWTTGAALIDMNWWDDSTAAVEDVAPISEERYLDPDLSIGTGFEALASVSSEALEPSSSESSEGHIFQKLLAKVISYVKSLIN